MRFALPQYQSKELMEKYGVRVQKGDVADNAASAGAVSEKLKSESECPARASKGEREGGSPKKRHDGHTVPPLRRRDWRA